MWYVRDHPGFVAKKKKNLDGFNIFSIVPKDVLKSRFWHPHWRGAHKVNIISIYTWGKQMVAANTSLSNGILCLVWIRWWWVWLLSTFTVNSSFLLRRCRLFHNDARGSYPCWCKFEHIQKYADVVQCSSRTRPHTIQCIKRHRFIIAHDRWIVLVNFTGAQRFNYRLRVSATLGDDIMCG